MGTFIVEYQPTILTRPQCYILVLLLFKPPTTPPYLPMLFASLQVIISATTICIHIVTENNVNGQLVELVNVFLAIAFTWLGGTLPIQHVRPAKYVAKPQDTPSNALSMPEDDVTFWSWCTFDFVEPLLHVATRRTINEDDVWSLSPFFRHENLFKKCLRYRTKYPNHSLLWFLLVSNSFDLTLDLSLEIWKSIMDFVQPYAIKEILTALSSHDPAVKRTAYYWALLIFVVHLSFAQKDLITGWHIRRCYERTRGQLFCTLHYKALKRQESGELAREDGKPGGADLGKIVNLMQGDSYAVAQRFWEFSGIFVSPIRLIIALIFLYRVLGWSALSGVAVILLAYVLNYPLARYNISITRSSWKARDRRMGLVNELLQNIRFLKFYGWEYHWSRNALESREIELQWRVKQNIVNTLISFIWTWLLSATALVSFFCYTWIAGERLTVSKAFTAVALFSQLQGPMTALPGQIFALLDAYVSMQRIEEFLREPEVPDWASGLSGDEDRASADDDEIGFRNASFLWQSIPRSSETPSRFQLGPLNLSFPKSSITLVTGATGSGKSALLSALLGEMHCIDGTVSINKSYNKVAYCAQNAWLEHATIRDNIIFKSKAGFDEDRYQAVLDACALRKDLEVLDAGDLTEIGEKGITLSGGQRARIALARSVYSPAELLLLDDPLAAVDMHTAQHLVTECLQGKLLQGRTVILVTHHVGLCLPAAAQLVELGNGQVIRQIDRSRFNELNVTSPTPEEPEEVDGVYPHIVNEADIDATLRREPTQVAPAPKVGKLIEAEARAEGRVSMKTYLTYIRAAGILAWIGTITLMLLIWCINISNQVFLARWGEAYEKSFLAFVAQFIPVRYPWDDLPPPDIDVRPWLMVYLSISMAGAITVMLYITLGYYAGLQASRALFKTLLQRLTRAPTRFFDVTPTGRILNRFTTDINTIDGALQNSARSFLSGSLGFFASFMVMLFVVPSFTPFALFIAWLYIRLAPRYINASRDLRRLESISLSPAFAGFDELLRGIVHIRAFGMENRYQDQFYAKVNRFQAFDHWLVNGWLRWRYDLLGSVVVFFATLFALWMDVGDGATAIVIVQSGVFAEASRQLVKVAAQVELDFNSVERVTEYFEVPQEAPAVIEKNRPPAYWPSDTGRINVDSLCVRYAPHLPPVLHDLSFSINPSEKVGVVGRTGSGKSTLALSLLRMVEPSNGTVFIDDIDISTIGLEDLRTRITIISQDVSLFSGTIRSNLDPFDEHSDVECLEVLKRCHLSNLLQNTPNTNDTSVLDMTVSQNSLSAGEKQLVALARAILRRTNIIIMDEATSQVDVVLDDKIQRTIREELASAIVITIAHRLKTIIDYDRILVLDNGKIAEFDSPRTLLTKEGGTFREMCRKSADWSYFVSLLEIAASTPPPT
ncbi:P-loop containing nucleoside triphosphate hydrolase protein [Pluteus cervinus]|uniref:P-loop containing nucleoside triphosphate hydrolase protein n=1 Tax=Pluteus cervinus TaxID=181527 RepID=A0ACD3BH26_9AGAR|nr:P-loop containing nucleoside triphosphate hydrolase protein [Pluteus cervinus]